MRCLVTGTAGFIGSHLAERLLAAGHEVTGIDCLIPYYSPARKRRNLAPLLEQGRFRFVEGDLAEFDLAPLVEGADLVFHQAAQAGVRASWGAGFPPYVRYSTWSAVPCADSAGLLPRWDPASVMPWKNVATMATRWPARSSAGAPARWAACAKAIRACS